MKLIIEHNGVKREISGPFEVCCSVADLLELADQARTAVRVAEDEGHTYGWLLKVPAREVTRPLTVKRWDE